MVYFKSKSHYCLTIKYKVGVNNLLRLSPIQCGKCHENTITCLSKKSTSLISWHLPLFCGNQQDLKITYRLRFILTGIIRYVYTKIKRQVSIICKVLPHRSTVSVMKILSFAFPRGSEHEYPDICRFFAETNMNEKFYLQVKI